MEGDLGWHYGGDGYNNWDLDAIVRLGSGGGAAIAPPYDDPFFALPPPQQDVLPDANVWQQALDMPAMAQADPATAGLDDDFLTQIFSGAPQPPQPSSPTNEVPPVQGAANLPPAVDKPDSSRGGGSSSSRPKQTRRSKKNTEDMAVMTIPLADFASADVWSWRKYGQKPIKGSPYRRGYYRCSTDKACPARKLVERCITDPSFLIVAYTGEHSHALPRIRNALAGTARHKREAPSRRAPADVMMGRPSQAPPPPVFASFAAISPPTTPRTVSKEFDAEEEDDDVAVKALIDNAVMAPENAFLFLKPDDAPPAPVTAGERWQWAPPDATTMASYSRCRKSLEW